MSVCFMACLTYPDSTLCWYHALGTKHTIINLLECMSGVCVFHGVFNIPRQYAMLVSCAGH